jgi:thioredoxin 1
LSFQFPSGDGLVLVDFYADWCEPCKWALPVIENVLKHFEGKILLEKCDIDAHPEIAAHYKVLSVPTFILFRNKQEIWRMRGFDIAPVMIRKINSAIESVGL